MSYTSKRSVGNEMCPLSQEGQLGPHIWVDSIYIYMSQETLAISEAVFLYVSHFVSLKTMKVIFK